MTKRGPDGTPFGRDIARQEFDLIESRLNVWLEVGLGNECAIKRKAIVDSDNWDPISKEAGRAVELASYLAPG